MIKKPMTAEERAEYVLKKHTTAYVFGGVYHIDNPLLLIKSIAAEIKLAEDAAYRRGVKEERKAIIYDCESSKGYTVEFNKDMDYVIDLIRSRPKPGEEKI